MTAANQRSARELIASLCDGQIQPEDRIRLMCLLRDDPLLQNEYLDQAIIEGMLRYEFGVDRPSIPNQFINLSSGYVFKLTLGTLFISLLACVLLGGYWWFKLNRLVDIPIKLSNLSFESDHAISETPVMSGWYGDEAQSVTGDEGCVAPHGNRMLQLVRSLHQPANECEVYQLLDFSTVSTTFRQQPLFLEAKMVANARAYDNGTTYTISLELYTYSDLPKLEIDVSPDRLGENVKISANKIAADSDPLSWQELRLLMPLSKDARYGIVKISARESGRGADDKYKEIFIDDVQVRMTNRKVF